MPAFDLDSQSPGGSFEPQPSDNWSMPLGAVAGIRLSVSYSVFVAFAVLSGLVAMVQGRQGNSDLPWVALTAVTIWCFGWGVQLCVQLCLHFWSSAKSESITIGLLGVETTSPLHRRYPWSAMANLMSACFSLTGLVLFGAASLVIHMLTRSVDYWSTSAWLSELATPSFGMDAVTNCYLTATWLLWIQAAFQAYPLPRNLGRAALASAVVLFAGEANDEFQVRLLRRALQMIAVITMVIAMATMIADTEVFLPRWQILVLLAVYLWVSTKKQDLRDWIASVHLAAADPVAIHFEVPRQQPTQRGRKPGNLTETPAAATPWISEMMDSVKMRQKRKRARAAMKREREEASDAARLDQVLKVVSEHGTDGLSSEDRALLMRVSKNLRRHRESQPGKGQS